MSVDPLSKSYPGITPYQFASNSPTGGIDVDGLEFLSVNSSIYRQKYAGFTFLNKIYDKYIVETVYENIPASLKNPNTRDLKFTKGGPVTAYGRDWDTKIDGAYFSSPGRFNNDGPDFFGKADDAKSPSQTNSVRGNPSVIAPDGLRGKEYRETSNQNNSKHGAGAGVLKQVLGIGGNLSNQDIWSGMFTEIQNRSAFYKATRIVDNYSKSIQEGALRNGQGRVDLINFLTDGTLPASGKNIQDLSKKELEYNLKIIYSGVQLFYKEDIDVREQTSKNFSNLNDAYKRKGGKLNFDKITEYKRPN